MKSEVVVRFLSENDLIVKVSGIISVIATSINYDDDIMIVKYGRDIVSIISLTNVSIIYKNEVA